MPNLKRTRFKEFLVLQRGFDLPKKDMANGPYPVVGSTSVIGHHDEFKVNPPGIVTGRSGSLGCVQYIRDKYWPHNTSLWVKDFKGNFPQYVYYHLLTLDLKRFNSGVGVPTLNRNDLDMLEVSIPPLPTQRKIASILSAYDDLIENNMRRIKILEEMAQRIYREWFVNFRFPGHEKVKMVQSELGLIPEGWRVARVPEAIDINPFTKVKKEETKPYVPMDRLSNNSMLVAAAEYREGNSGSKFRNGDTLFARITPCLENGKTGYVQFLQSDEDVAIGSTEFIVLRSKTVCPEFVYLLSRTEYFRGSAIKSMVGASGRQRVQLASLEKFLFVHPDTQTLDDFRQMAYPIFKQVQTLANKNMNLRRTRDLLLPKLISGEVDVEQLDINVETERVTP